MEIYQEELKIVDYFRKNILSELTIQELMKKLKKNSYNWTYNALTKLGKSILNVKRVGKAHLISINLQSNETIAYFAYLDKKEAAESNIPLAWDIVNSISKKTPFFTFLATGSYAKKTQRKDSDLDLIIIVNKNQEKKEITPYIKEITRLSQIKADYYIFTKQEFYTMLTNGEENLGKEAFRHHLLFYGNETYYQIIKEAMKNGLSAKI